MVGASNEQLHRWHRLIRLSRSASLKLSQQLNGNAMLPPTMTSRHEMAKLGMAVYELDEAEKELSAMIETSK